MTLVFTARLPRPLRLVLTVEKRAHSLDKSTTAQLNNSVNIRWLSKIGRATDIFQIHMYIGLSNILKYVFYSYFFTYNVPLGTSWTFGKHWIFWPYGPFGNLWISGSFGICMSLGDSETLDPSVTPGTFGTLGPLRPLGPIGAILYTLLGLPRPLIPLESLPHWISGLKKIGTSKNLILNTWIV